MQSKRYFLPTRINLEYVNVYWRSGGERGGDGSGVCGINAYAPALSDLKAK
jgi:hypothetical protein